MSLLQRRFEPFNELATLQDRMNRLFGEVNLPSQMEGEMTTANWMPAVDIYETPQEVVIEAQLPGVDQKDINVSVADGRLTLNGERKRREEIKNDHYHKIECSYGSFARTFSLPSTIDSDRIKAECKDGILKIMLPKREAAKAKQISIAVGK